MEFAGPFLVYRVGLFPAISLHCASTFSDFRFPNSQLGTPVGNGLNGVRESQVSGRTMRPRHSILVLSLVILAACGSDEGNERGGNESPEDQAGAIERPIETYRGLYTWATELNQFRPCDSVLAYWVVGPRRVVERLKMKYSQVAIRPYDVVYVELSGRIIDGPIELEDAGEFPGRFQVSEILVVRARQEGDCPPPRG